MSVVERGCGGNAGLLKLHIQSLRVVSQTPAPTGERFGRPSEGERRDPSPRASPLDSQRTDRFVHKPMVVRFLVCGALDSPPLVSGLPAGRCLLTRRLSDDRAKGVDCLGLHNAQAPGRVHCALSGLQRHSARGPRGPQRAREATSQSRREHGTAQPVKQYFEYNTHLFLSGWRSWPEVGGRFSFDLCDVVDG